MNVIASLRKKTSTPNVYIRVIDGRGIDFRASTPLQIEQCFFDSKIPGYIDTPEVPEDVRTTFNAKLAELINKVREEYTRGLDLNWLNHLVDEYFNPHLTGDSVMTETDFFDKAEQYLIECKGGKEHNQSMKAVFRRLHRYEAWQCKMEGRTDFQLTLATFDEQEMNHFLDYVEDEYKHYSNHKEFFDNFTIFGGTIRPVSGNSRCSIGNRLKGYLNWAYRKGFKVDTSYNNVETRKYLYGTPYFLTVEERDQLLNANLDAYPKARIARDMFVFQCLIGCRIGDFYKMTRANIVNGWVEYYPGKNIEHNIAELVRVPLCAKALEILDKYKEYTPRLFPHLKRQDYSTYTRFALDVAGLHRMVTVINPLTRQEEQRPLYEVVTSHVARKTFTGNLYNKVKDQELVASLTGHAPGSPAFQRYRTVDDSLKRELIDKLT